MSDSATLHIVAEDELLANERVGSERDASLCCSAAEKKQLPVKSVLGVVVMADWFQRLKKDRSG